jgi:hypothetical protein
MSCSPVGSSSRGLLFCRWSVAVSSILFLWPGNVVACQVCADQGVHFSLPYGVPVGFVLAAWIAVACCFRNRLKRLGEDDAAERGAPAWNAVVNFAWILGAGLFVGMFTLTPHIFLGLIATGWIIYLTVKIAKVLNRSPQSPEARLFFRMNVAALVVSLIVVPSAFAWARMPKNVVAFLGNPLIVGRVAPAVIALGDRATPHLNDELERWGSGDGYVPTYHVTQACYCLARIGTPAAEASLRRFVMAQGEHPGVGNERWQLVACCSFAECAGSRAVPDLKQLYATSAGKDFHGLQIASLCGLARTGDPEGVTFVREHRDVLRPDVETTSLHPAVLATASQIADAIASDCEVTTFRTMPLYGGTGIGLGIPTDSPTAHAGH